MWILITRALLSPSFDIYLSFKCCPASSALTWVGFWGVGGLIGREGGGIKRSEGSFHRQNVSVKED